MSERACRGCRGHLSALLDGELSPRRERSVRRHLEGCEECRGRLEELRLVARETSLLSEPPPEGLESGILRALEDGLREEERAPSPAWRSPLLVAASAVVLAGVVGLGVVGLSELPPFTGPTRPSELGGPAPDPDRGTSEKREGEDARAGALARGLDQAETLAATEVDAPDASARTPEAQGAGGVDSLAPPRKASSAPAEGESDGTIGLREEIEQLRRQKDGALGGGGELEVKRAAVEGADEAPEEERPAVFAAEPSVAESRPAPRSAGQGAEGVGFADGRELDAREDAVGKKGPAEGCGGPPVAEPGPGEVLGCPAPSGDQPVRVSMEAVEGPEADAVLGKEKRDREQADLSPRSRVDRVGVPAEEADQDEATRAAGPWLPPRPVPVPAAAAGERIEMVLDLRLASDGSVLAAEAVPPAPEGSLGAAVCEAVTRWRFLPGEGAGGAAERTLRLRLVLEPAPR
jgi:hypothetical protein